MNGRARSLPRWLPRRAGSFLFENSGVQVMEHLQELLLVGDEEGALQDNKGNGELGSGSGLFDLPTLGQYNRFYRRELNPLSIVLKQRSQLF